MGHVDCFHAVTLNKNNLSFKCDCYILILKLGKYTCPQHLTKARVKALRDLGVPANIAR
jgi:hypothetical protein